MKLSRHVRDLAEVLSELDPDELRVIDLVFHALVTPGQAFAVISDGQHISMSGGRAPEAVDMCRGLRARLTQTLDAMNVQAMPPIHRH